MAQLAFILNLYNKRSFIKIIYYPICKYNLSFGHVTFNPQMHIKFIFFPVAWMKSLYVALFASKILNIYFKIKIIVDWKNTYKYAVI